MVQLVVGGRGQGALGHVLPGELMCETYLPLATGEGDVDEAAGVYEPLPGAALGDLLLLLGLNLHAEIPCQPLFRILPFPFACERPIWNIPSPPSRPCR